MQICGQYSYSWRSSASIYRSYSIYGGQDVLAITSGLLVLSNTVMSATPRSLYLYSSFQLLRLTGALFTGFTTIIPTCVQLDLSYFLQSYKTHIFLNAYIFSELYDMFEYCFHYLSRIQCSTPSSLIHHQD